MPTLFEKLRNKYGELTISTFGERAEEDMQVVSTGSMTLDFATGLGGIPLGRVVQIFGE
jgi:recombination protein RecA